MEYRFNADLLEEPVLLLNRHEWEMQGCFTKEQLDQAETTDGFIGYRLGAKCYLTKFIESTYEK